MTNKFTFNSVDDFTQAKLKRDLNRKLFTIVAPRYNLITRLLSFGNDRKWKKQLVSGLPKNDKATCVDLACGTGDLCALLKQHAQHGCIIGLDLTPAMLQLAQLQNNNINYLRGDMMQLPFQDNSIDIFTGGYALRNAPDLDKTLAMIFSKIKPGGTANFLEFSRSSKPWLAFFQISILTAWANLCGILVHANRKVYDYIPASLKWFPPLEKLKKLTESQGFIQFQSKAYLTGVITLVSFKKPNLSSINDD